MAWHDDGAPAAAEEEEEESEVGGSGLMTPVRRRRPQKQGAGAKEGEGEEDGGDPLIFQAPPRVDRCVFCAWLVCVCGEGLGSAHNTKTHTHF